MNASILERPGTAHFGTLQPADGTGPRATQLLDRRIFDPDFARIVDELSRRGFLGGLAGTAGLLSLAACGSAADGRPTASASPSTLTVQTSKGPVSIPAQPKRIVCVDPYTPFDLLGLGITPVGVPTYGGAIAADQKTTFAAITRVDTAGGDTDLEKVAALHPDLIFGLDYQENYAQLTAIAPTVFLHFNTSADWPAIAEACAAALGRTGQEKTLAQRYQAKAQAVRTAHAATLARLKWDMVADGGDGKYALYYPDSGNGHVLADAGVQFATASAGKTGALAQVSFEQLGQLSDADVLLYTATTKSLLTQPGWQRLPAVTAGHAYSITNAFPNNYSVALALLEEIDAILTRLEKTKS